MSSYFEIGGHVVVLEHTSPSSSSLGGIAAERPERGRKSAKAESVRRAFGSNDIGESRPGLAEHYLRSLWFGASEPTKRAYRLFSPKSMSFRTTPKHLIWFAGDITLDQLENQYDYFVLGETPDY